MSINTQPADFFKLLHIKHTEEAEKILSSVLAFLVYMPVGDKIETSSLSFEKLSKDLIYVDSKASLERAVESMDKNKIIRLPI